MSEVLDRKSRYDLLMDEFFKDDDKLASSADEKCQKIYDHMKMLVSEKEELQNRLGKTEDKESKKSIKQEIQSIDSETNALLNLLSKHSMQF
jgi:ElaB/YqjD/DUF883 family membrane-anchored ribosome-binding protein